MKAILLTEPGKVTLVDMEKPQPGPGEALVRVLEAGICGSELHGYHGRHFGRRPPVVMGHEVCGVVETLGEGVTGPPPGTRVAAMPQRTCGRCRPCRDGTPNLCRSRLMLGFTDWPGAYAEYFVIPADLLFEVADGVGAAEATLTEPLAVAVHAVRRAGIGPGQSAIVFGAGAIGLLTVLAAREAGAATVIATDLHDYNLAVARDLGATDIHNAQQGSVLDLARDVAGGEGVDHAFLATDGAGVVEQAVHAVRVRGRIIVIAMYDGPAPVPLQELKSKEQAMIGSVTYEAGDFTKACEIAAAHRSALSRLVTHRVAMEDAQDAFELVDQRREDLVRVVFHVSEDAARP